MGPGHFSAENNNLRVLNMNTVVCLHMKLCNLVLAGEKNGAKQKSQPAGPVFLSHSTPVFNHLRTMVVGKKLSGRK